MFTPWKLIWNEPLRAVHIARHMPSSKSLLTIEPLFKRSITALFRAPQIALLSEPTQLMNEGY
jgi:hypothetical protein